MTQERDLTVLAFAGSLRRGSYNRALLRAAREVAPAGMTISIFEIDEVPLYNGDVEDEGLTAPDAPASPWEGRARGGRLRTCHRDHVRVLARVPERHNFNRSRLICGVVVVQQANAVLERSVQESGSAPRRSADAAR